MDIQEVVDRVSSILLEEEKRGSFQIEEPPSFAKELIETFIELGWEPIDALDHCSKANQECQLKRNGFRLHLVSANFLGQFIQIAISQRG